MKSTWPNAMARRIGLSGQIEFTPTRVGLTLHVPCVKGNHMVDVTVEPGLHPDFVAKRMLSKGWTFGSKLACPEHGRRHKAVATATQQQDTPSMPSIAAAPPPAPEQSLAAKKALRLVMQLLEDAYDEANKCYRQGWSDARVAEETGASPKYVADTREGYFGPIGEPAELRALRDDLAKLVREQGAAHSDFVKRAEALQNRLAAIAKANGWPHPV